MLMVVAEPNAFTVVATVFHRFCVVSSPTIVALPIVVVPPVPAPVAILTLVVEPANPLVPMFTVLTSVSAVGPVPKLYVELSSDVPPIVTVCNAQSVQLQLIHLYQ
jgi:hypothetical protein